MKQVKSMILGILTFLALSAASPAQTTFIVGAPGAMPDKTARVVLSAIEKLLYEAKPGDEIRVYDAWSCQLFGSFTVPNTSSKKGRRIRTASELNAIVRAIAATSSVGSVPQNQIRFPAFTKVVGASLRSGAGDVRVILFGGPYYTDRRDEGFTFGSGTYPSDPHIYAASSESIFGTKGKKGALAGCTIHYCYLDTDNFTSGLDTEAVTRFWHLFVSCEQSGVLASFAASADDVVKRALSGAKDPVSSEKIDRTDTKIEMRRVGGKQAHKEQLTPELEPEPTSVKNLLPVNAELVEAVKKVPQPKKGILSVAAAWISEDGAADIDIYVRAHPKAAELNFQNMATPEGTYFRDVQKPGAELKDADWKASWEVVELKAATLEASTCWLNLYASSGAKIEGIVRLVFDKRTLDIPFSFIGLGDKAAGRTQREGNVFWLPIELSKFWKDSELVNDPELATVVVGTSE